jgi:NADPH-dependent glutamate synthase beta subunit-like oxidoreductase/NAD(P)H-flavin reductase
MKLAFGFAFDDLYARDGLARIDGAFADFLKAADVGLHDRLMIARANPEALAAKDEGNLLVDLGPQVDAFVAKLFAVESEVDELAKRTHALAPLYAVKRLFVQRKAAKAHKPEDAAKLDGAALAARLDALLGAGWSELAFAEAVTAWEKDEAANEEKLDAALAYAAWALASAQGKAKHKPGVLFKAPHKIDPLHLVPVETIERHGVRMQRLPEHEWRGRDGFALTDAGMDLEKALDQTNYCIWCHPQGKDSCSKGLKDKKTGAFQKTVFGAKLAGCPLEEKISEMHALKAQGHALGAFATILVDNPMVAATGHRICNDCMKACIYQKQEPVDIPQAETRILKDVLALPWGFEIYALLTRWNPLNIRRPIPKPESGYKVLVVGLGPAGYTLAHHLMNDGHAVAAIDGLKIEPLPAAISGVDPSGARVRFEPIHDVDALYENLDERVLAGFGGVAEYGITVRWDKNFLKLIRLLLERRAHFAMYGGVRFGGTVTFDQAWALGFDHVALCMGAGKPTIVDMPNGLARGLRQASDFLMALQLTGAAKKDSIANLTLRLPVVVIGGGLTAIDTATESLAYYVRQVEKFASRHAILAAERGDGAVRKAWSAEDRTIAEEWLAHAAELGAEREAAKRENRAPNFSHLLASWGGATIAYRRKLIEAPSYTLNHEEVAKALEEGVDFAEGLTPLAVETDEFGAAKALKVKTAEGVERTLPARAILVAAGTQPNTVLAHDAPGVVELHGKFFAAVAEDGSPVEPERATSKPAIPHVLVQAGEGAPRISYFGDLHPSYSGNVVKAMGSAKQGYPVVSRALAARPPSKIAWTELRATLDASLRAVVHAVNRLTPTIVEVVVKAPAAARNFRPGQFYRLQNYEAFAKKTDGTVLAMEGLAMTGAWVDVEKGLLATIVLEMGGSSDLCAGLTPGENVILMGPTGAPTHTPAGETVALVGGGLGNAVLFSIGAALRKAGSKVVYFAGYKALRDRYKVEQIEAAADVVIWACDEAPGFPARRPQDKSFVGNIVTAMEAYATGKLGAAPIKLQDCDRIVAIGSDRMMQAVGKARHGLLKPCVKPGHEAIGSINSPMQCMMKEICAQCLQPHVDPETGARTVVFSCFDQDQKLDKVDFEALNERLKQNSLQEKLTAQWIDRCLKRLDLRAAAE